MAPSKGGQGGQFQEYANSDVGKADLESEDEDEGMGNAEEMKEDTFDSTGSNKDTSNNTKQGTTEDNEKPGEGHATNMGKEQWAEWDYEIDQQEAAENSERHQTTACVSLKNDTHETGDDGTKRHDLVKEKSSDSIGINKEISGKETASTSTAPMDTDTALQSGEKRKSTAVTKTPDESCGEDDTTTVQAGSSSHQPTANAENDTDTDTWHQIQSKRTPTKSNKSTNLEKHNNKDNSAVTATDMDLSDTITAVNARASATKVTGDDRFDTKIRMELTRHKDENARNVRKELSEVFGIIKRQDPTAAIFSVKHGGAIISSPSEMPTSNEELNKYFTSVTTTKNDETRVTVLFGLKSRETIHHIKANNGGELAQSLLQNRVWVTEHKFEDINSYKMGWFAMRHTNISTEHHAERLWTRIKANVGGFVPKLDCIIGKITADEDTNGAYIHVVILVCQRKDAATLQRKVTEANLDLEKYGIYVPFATKRNHPKLHKQMFTRHREYLSNNWTITVTGMPDALLSTKVDDPETGGKTHLALVLTKEFTGIKCVDRAKEYPLNDSIVVTCRRTDKDKTYTFLRKELYYIAKTSEEYEGLEIRVDERRNTATSSYEDRLESKFGIKESPNRGYNQRRRNAGNDESTDWLGTGTAEFPLLEPRTPEKAPCVDLTNGDDSPWRVQGSKWNQPSGYTLNTSLGRAQQLGQPPAQHGGNWSNGIKEPQIKSNDEQQNGPRTSTSSPLDRSLDVEMTEYDAIGPLGMHGADTIAQSTVASLQASIATLTSQLTQSLAAHEERLGAQEQESKKQRGSLERIDEAVHRQARSMAEVMNQISDIAMNTERAIEETVEHALGQAVETAVGSAVVTVVEAAVETAVTNVLHSARNSWNASDREELSTAKSKLEITQDMVLALQEQTRLAADQLKLHQAIQEGTLERQYMVWTEQQKAFQSSITEQIGAITATIAGTATVAGDSFHPPRVVTRTTRTDDNGDEANQATVAYGSDMSSLTSGGIGKRVDATLDDGTNHDTPQQSKGKRQNRQQTPEALAVEDRMVLAQAQEASDDTATIQEHTSPTSKLNLHTVMAGIPEDARTRQMDETTETYDESIPVVRTPLSRKARNLLVASHDSEGNRLFDPDSDPQARLTHDRQIAQGEEHYAEMTRWEWDQSPQYAQDTTETDMQQALELSSALDDSIFADSPSDRFSRATSNRDEGKYECGTLGTDGTSQSEGALSPQSQEATETARGASSPRQDE